ISFDPNYRHLLFRDHTQTFIDQSWNFLNACHFFKLSDEEAMLITGAGDAFVGATLYQLKDKNLAAIRQMKTEDWQKLVTNANKAGARTCEYLGAMEAFKHLNNQIFD
ncbi:MAG: hypothetical protein B7Y76_04415, partial [Sphingobacteriia bacterium 35-40-5]